MPGTLAAPSSRQFDGSAGGRTLEAVHACLRQRWSAPIAAALVARAHLRPGDRVLDVGTGGGIVAAKAARCVGGNGGHVVGVDVSAARHAESRAARLGLPNVDFRCMPAEALDLPDATFDVVLSLFAFTHFRDVPAAVGEMRRVLRPGGRVVLGLAGRAPRLSRAGFTHHLHRLSLALASWTGRGLVAPAWLEPLRHVEGGVRPAPPLAGGPASVAAVHGAGFDRVATTWVSHDAVIESAEEFWEIQAAFPAPARAWHVAAGGRLVHPQEALLISARRA
jgi:SAM-dependent methyltransferase